MKRNSSKGRGAKGAEGKSRSKTRGGQGHSSAQGQSKGGRRPGTSSQAPSHRTRSEGAHVSSGGRSGHRSPRSEQEGGGRDKARWVVGLHSCEETLKVRHRAIREIWLREDYLSSQQLRDLAEAAGRQRIAIKTKSIGQLDQVGSGHQGVALAVTESPELDWAALAAPGRQVLLALDGIEDPHNLGSMLRTAWLTGVSGILIPEDRAVGLTPSVCKVASGGAEHVPVDSHTNLPSAIEKLKEIGFWVYGLSEKGTRKPWDFNLPEKVLWVVGSEGSGMRVPTERVCDELVRVPQVQTGSSYNASIAVAMALAETCRQFGKPD